MSYKKLIFFSKKKYFYHTTILNSPFCDKYTQLLIRSANFDKKNKNTCISTNKTVDWTVCRPQSIIDYKKTVNVNIIVVN
jgi:hypothetical protein